MSAEVSVVKCFDTVKRKYVEVEVPVEVATFYKRDYWREEMSERRYYQRAISLDGLYVFGNYSIEKEDSISENVLRKERLSRVYEEVAKLNEREKELVYLVLVKEHTVTEAAKILRVSVSYASRCLKKAKLLLRGRLQDIQN